MAKFHYADFPETKLPGRGSFGEVGVMEFGLYYTALLARVMTSDSIGSGIS